MSLRPMATAADEIDRVLQTCWLESGPYQDKFN